ncbi:MurR/RpiR family transcriptional regulator [Phytoactinopolyspora mesophila]|uniref:SIS domain-containing protein n=1 Tax=Phytoactinopolyspora mesophila TaxID=2650750 RepID=A0A7K3LY72_9ACTN|nr:MurR/RpiR family transcriptional regulator [Phytoactinopolyspora mesophila]NDL55940.1 SIS domain-containing protein [Phytoactinopolyspora mesophila]
MTTHTPTTAPPPSPHNALVHIRAALPTLRPAEQRVAAAVIEDPAGVSESSISKLAEQCMTSEATVLRFCRAVGFRGYPDLRMALTRDVTLQEATSHHGPIDGTINATDDLRTIVAKITANDAQAIEDTVAALDLNTLELAVDAVTTARKIDIYGAGASGVVAEDLHQKLRRIGLFASGVSDPHVALTSASLLTTEDVAVAISHAGTTADTVDMLHVAKQNGATTIAVTNVPRSPLGGHADYVLMTAARETTFRSGAMASRIAQLAVVDCLFVGVAHRRYEETLAALDKTRSTLQTRRVQPRRRQ